MQQHVFTDTAVQLYFLQHPVCNKLLNLSYNTGLSTANAIGNLFCRLRTRRALKSFLNPFIQRASAQFDIRQLFIKPNDPPLWV